MTFKKCPETCYGVAQFPLNTLHNLSSARCEGEVPVGLWASIRPFLEKGVSLRGSCEAKIINSSEILSSM